MTAMMTRPGRIFTFYSYKGGTGRSMILANVAWVLASSGCRVLAVDWDLEAPGLHRYFRPFMLDKDLIDTEGVIDFVGRFVDSALTPPEGKHDSSSEQSLADLSYYAVSLNWDRFPPGGCLEFVPAGKQGLGYASRVNSFDWHSFYERMGGAAFLEKTRHHLRSQYDYILIDSRTGVSDTAGICTVQLPDVLVAAFTFNTQSIEGVSAVLESVQSLRQHDITFFPVPMRVELAEKERLERARDYSRKVLDRYITNIPAPERSKYWGDIEVTYQPFYAYDETLAPFADRAESPTSLLAAVERICGYLTAGEVARAEPLTEDDRQRILQAFGEPFSNLGEAGAPGRPVVSDRTILISYPSAPEGRTFALRLAAAFEAARPPERVWLADRDLEPGVNWAEQIRTVTRRCRCALAVIGPPGWQPDGYHLWQEALAAGKPVIPVLMQRNVEIPDELVGHQAAEFFDDAGFEGAVAELRAHLDELDSPAGQADLTKRWSRDGSATPEPGPSAGTDRVFLIQLLAHGQVRITSQRGGTGTSITGSLGFDDTDLRLAVLLGNLVRTGKLDAAPDLEAFGSLLYRGLFSGAVQALFEREVSGAMEDDGKLHVVLELDGGTTEVSALPWEFLFYPPSPLQPTGFFLAQQRNLILSRRSHEAHLARPVTPVDLPLQILDVTDPDAAAAGFFYPRGRLSDPRAVVTALQNPSRAKLYDAVNRLKPNVIHLALHSSPDPVSGSQKLLLSSETGQMTQIGQRDIGRLIGTAPSVRLIVLDACSSAQPATEGAGTLGQQMALGAPSATLAVDGPLSTDEHERFFRTLYDGLLSGVPVDEAVQNARIALSIVSDRPFWALGVPMLYLPGPAGPLTRGSYEPETASAAEPETAPVADQKENAGAVATVGKGDRTEPPAPALPAEDVPAQASKPSLWARIAAWFRSIFSPGGTAG